ncbi:MAG: oligonucleotide/oligosaccharide-binding fold domain-containing protein [Candidatus Paceibacterota bacterium]
MREEIIQTIIHNQVVVFHGDTGSGKTSMLPLFLLEAGCGEFGIIGVTEPRRLAVFSPILDYISSFIDSNKRIVGGHTRFRNTTNADTKIKLMTDGILLELIQRDPLLSEFSAIIIDEVHERSKNIDVLVGLLKRLMKDRPDLHIGISSATVEAEKFAKYFGNAPIIKIEGRSFPIEYKYSDVPLFGEDFEPYNRKYGKDFNPRDIPALVARKIRDIVLHEEKGDILAFLPGVKDIKLVMEFLEGYNLPNTKVLPAYGQMDMDEQALIFEEYPGMQKIIVATNVARTSITPKVRHVVDCMMEKQMDFYADSKRSSLQTVPISQSAADQGGGRCGRIEFGICHRLCTEEEYGKLMRYPKPEICRTCLAETVLTMRYMGIDDVEHFDFPDPPPLRLFKEAFETLKSFGALDNNEVLTKLGIMMAILPLDPYLSKILLDSKRFGCIEEVATFVSFISAGHVKLRPPEQEEEADAAHERFDVEESDALTCLKIWEEYKQHIGDTEWCAENFMNEGRLVEVGNIRNQLLEILNEFGISASTTTNKDSVLKAVAAGLISNLFKLKKDKDGEKKPKKEEKKPRKSNSYYLVKKNEKEKVEYAAFIHPRSSTFGARPELLVALEVIRTSRQYLNICSKVDPKWLPELYPENSSKKGKILVGMKSGGGAAFVKSVVHTDGAVIGTMNEKISLDDARRIQKENIAKAMEEGCEKIYFKRRKTRRGGLYVNVRGHEYVPSKDSLVDPKENVTYFAFLRTEKVGKTNRHFADVRFQVFDFADTDKKREKKGKQKKQNAKKKAL